VLGLPIGTATELCRSGSISSSIVYKTASGIASRRSSGSGAAADGALRRRPPSPIGRQPDPSHCVHRRRRRVPDPPARSATLQCALRLLRAMLMGCRAGSPARRACRDCERSRRRRRHQQRGRRRGPQRWQLGGRAGGRPAARQPARDAAQRAAALHQHRRVRLQRRAEEVHRRPAGGGEHGSGGQAAPAARLGGHLRRQ
jgi:hypothetical protein